MDKNIRYKNTDILFKNLLETGWNIDKFIIDGTIFNRHDHNYDMYYKHLRPGDVVWDIGAYIGTFAIPFAITGHDVYAFEGFFGNFNRLVENCKPYDIKCYQCALSNENKTENAFLIDCQDQEVKVKSEINYVKFDEYIASKKIPDPKFVKMDIEGYESLALLEMTNVLENIRPIWQIGYHHPGNIKIDEKFQHFVEPEDGGFNFQRFEELDYIVYDLKTNKHSKFQWGDCNGEYICIPKERIKTK